MKPQQWERNLSNVLNASRPDYVTDREAEYVRLRASGSTVLQAYQGSGSTRHLSNPVVAADAMEKRMMGGDWVREIATNHGLTLDVIMLKIAEGLDATLQKEYIIKPSGEEAGEPYVMQGAVRPDYKTRLSYLNLLSNMLGVSKPDDTVTTTNNTINIVQIGAKLKGKSADDLKRAMQLIRSGNAAALEVDSKPVKVEAIDVVTEEEAWDI